MKKLFIFLILAASSATLVVSEFERCVELEKEIRGNWMAAEYFMAQPPPELQQPIKTISFLADNMIEWEYVQDGKMHKAEGRYGIYLFSEDPKKLGQLPKLIVVPSNYTCPVESSNLLLTLSDFELDFDSRFIQNWGKLIKAQIPDGKRVLFLRKHVKIVGKQPTEHNN